MFFLIQLKKCNMYIVFFKATAFKLNLFALFGSENKNHYFYNSNKKNEKLLRDRINYICEINHKTILSHIFLIKLR